MQPRKTIVIGSAVVALLVTGTLLRWVRVSRATEAMAYTAPAKPLAELPEFIGRFRFVKDLPLTSAVLKAAGVDSFIQRDYVDPASGKHLLLYVGYWGRENRGAGHGPEICYPAVGWTADCAAIERPLGFRASGESTPAVMALHRFIRSEPEGIEKRAVGFLAVASGEYRPSSRRLFWHRPGKSHGRGHYLAQVQVSCPVPSGIWEQGESRIVAFMEALLPHLSDYLPQPRQAGEGSEPLAKGGDDLEN